VKFDEGKVWGYSRKIAELSRPFRGVWSRVEKPLFEKRVLDPERLTLPDFLGLGAPQSGSTWLHRNLRAHPEVFLPEEKELHFFDRNFHRSLLTYGRVFRPGKDRIKGEITPGYSVLNLAQIRFIRAVIPNVRLVYLLRNPIDQRLSRARRALGRRHKDPFLEMNEEDVFSFLKHAAGKKAGLYDPGLRRHNYASILRNWWSVFPRDQMFVGFFDDLVKRPQHLLEGVFSHLGASPEVDWSTFPMAEKINPNPQIPVPKKFRDFLVELLHEEIEELHELLGSPVNGWRCVPESSS
jgi:hypothetical protein